VIPRPSVRLAAILALTLAVLFAALPTDALTPGKLPHIGYLWIGAEGSDRVTPPGLQQGLRELVRLSRLADAHSVDEFRDPTSIAHSQLIDIVRRVARDPRARALD
jgi:hypothetical protein